MLGSLNPAIFFIMVVMVAAACAKQAARDERKEAAPIAAKDGIVNIATIVPSNWILAAGGEEVYWVTGPPQGGPTRIFGARPGENPSLVAASDGYVTSIAVDGATVIWGSTVDGVVRLDRKTGIRHTLVAGPLDWPRMSVTEGVLYFADRGSISRIDLAGGAMTVLATGQRHTTPRAGGGYVYWANDTLRPASDEVARVSTGGGAVQILAREQADACCPVVVGEFLYWLNRDETIAGGPSIPKRAQQPNLMKSALDGNGAAPLVLVPSGSNDLVVVNGDLMWITEDDVVRLPRGTNGPESIARTTGRGVALAVGDDYVYWLELVGTSEDGLAEVRAMRL